jgi:hypothetical protein
MVLGQNNYCPQKKCISTNIIPPAPPGKYQPMSCGKKYEEKKEENVKEKG